MAKLPVILVHFAMILLMQSQGSTSKNETGLWVLNVRQTQSITVRPDGTVISTNTEPSLYSLFRLQKYHEDVSSSIRMVFTIESMATNRFICMNKKGELITKEKEAPKGKQKRSPPPSHSCLFYSYPFIETPGGSGDYTQFRGIYTHGPRSNGTVGRFIAFDKDGIPFKYSRKLSKIRKVVDIVIRFMKPTNMDKIIKRTRFQRCNGAEGSKSFNRAVRRCLKTSEDVNDPNRLVRKNFFKILYKCKRTVESSLCFKKVKPRKNNSERTNPVKPQKKKSNGFRRFNQAQEHGDPCDCADWISSST